MFLESIRNAPRPPRLLPCAGATVTVLLLAWASAGAQTAVSTGSHPSRALFGLTLGNEYGFGGAARLGSSAVAIEVGAGVAPLLFIALDQFSDRTYVKLWTPGQVGAKLCLGSAGGSTTFEFGASYNSILKSGFGGGVNFGLGAGTHHIVSAGFLIFPDAENRLRLRLNEDEGTSYTKDQISAPLAAFQPYVSYSLLFGPKP